MKKIIFVCFLTMAVASHSFADEIDEVREILLAEEGGDILYLSRIKYGFPGGDNWIANRSDGNTYIYTISDEKEIRMVTRRAYPEQSKVRYWDSNTRSYISLEYNVMQGIHGTQLGSKAVKFGDYNGDGKDDIFNLVDSAAFCSIWGYNTDKKEEEYYFAHRYDIISTKEPAPVIFANYQGTDGILIHFRDHLAKRYIWVFFTWDKESRKYVKMMEISADEIDRSIFGSWNSENGHIDSEPVVEEAKQTESVDFTIDSINTENQLAIQNSASAMPLWALFAIIGGAVVVVGGVVVFVVKRKKS